jgi:hypothetical protein
MSRRSSVSVVIVVAALVIGAITAVTVRNAGRTERSSQGAAGQVGRAGARTEGGNGAEEVQEESEVTAERLAAFQEARAARTFGGAAAPSDPAQGWAGSTVVNPNVDDWEPAVAADPTSPYVYVLTTRYGQPKTCPSHCPTPYITLTISSDGGATWGPQVPLCVCLGSGAQYDPVIEVVPTTGDVYAGFLNADRAGGFSTVFTKSSTHGQTWTDPVHVYGSVAWTDKDELTIGPTGQDIYFSWNGPTGGDLWVGQSHDYGATWTQTKVVDSKRYFYAYDGRVLPDGTVVFSESSVTYTDPGQAAAGDVWHHAIISRDGGGTWQNVIVDKVPLGEACVADGCSNDFYVGQTSVSTDANGRLVFAYEGPAVTAGPQRIYVRTSADEGRTWSARTALSMRGENATGPRLAATGSGDVRIWYMQTAKRDDPDAWNVWYRSSSDGGASWSSAIKLDDAPAGAAGYINANGFDEIYGDYGEIAITNTGKTVAVWGEGFSWTGPGGVWVNRQT